jgi:hypothetical protein
VVGSAGGILLVGAGVAGAALALALKERGLSFLWVAEGVGEASRVPVALVNPVRGKRGVLVPEGGEALEAARELYGRYAPLHLGLLRPVPEGEREAWERRLAGSGLRYLWRGEGLYLPGAFWLEPRPFLERVWAELGGVRDRVVAYAPGEVVLEGGRRLRPELVLYAGGARGAGVFGLEGRFPGGGGPWGKLPGPSRLRRVPSGGRGGGVAFGGSGEATYVPFAEVSARFGERVFLNANRKEELP